MVKLSNICQKLKLILKNLHIFNHLKNVRKIKKLKLHEYHLTYIKYKSINIYNKMIKNKKNYLLIFDIRFFK
jgi:hypothetical protein